MDYGRQPYGGRGGFGSGILDEFKNAFRQYDNGLMQIIFINLAVFVVMILLRVILIFSGAESVYSSILGILAIPASFDAFLHKPWTLITYFFLHEGFLHILFNMLFLYWFGIIIKEFLGSGKVISLYVLGGIIGGLFYLSIYNLVPYFANRVDASIMLGASAGVYAVVVGAATLAPNYVMHLLLLGPVRIKYIALFYVLLSFANTTGANAGGNLAHLGGAALGFIFIKQLQSGTDLGKPVHWFISFVKSFFVRQPKVRVTYKKSASEKASAKTKSAGTFKSKNTSDVSQDEIDAILDKISQAGYESLSKEEKQKLFNAGK